VEAGVVRLGAGQQAVEDVDGGARLHLARGAGLIDTGNEEGLATLVGERSGDRRQPQAIGVGLDDAGAFGPARGLVHPRPVGAQRREIDGEHGTRGQGHLGSGTSRGQADDFAAAHPLRSGMYWSRAKSENRVTLASNWSCTVPVGPWRCLPMITSALPLTRLILAIQSWYSSVPSCGFSRST